MQNDFIAVDTTSAVTINTVLTFLHPIKTLICQKYIQNCHFTIFIYLLCQNNIDLYFSFFLYLKVTLHLYLICCLVSPYISDCLTLLGPGLLCQTLFLKKNMGTGVLNPGAVFLRFVTEAFLLFLATAGGGGLTLQSLTFN